MAKLSGAAGTATFASTAVLITGWTCDATAEVIPTTDSGDLTWDKFIPTGFSQWSGTFEGFAIAGVADETIGATGTLVLEAGATDNYSGSAIITGISTVVDVPGAEAVKKAYTFQGTGTLTQATS